MSDFDTMEIARTNRLTKTALFNGTEKKGELIGSPVYFSSIYPDVYIARAKTPDFSNVGIRIVSSR